MPIKNLENDAVKALNRIHKVDGEVNAKEPEVKTLCKKCAALRPNFTLALKLIDRIPLYGIKVSSAVSLLILAAE